MKVDSLNVSALLRAGLTLDDITFEKGDKLPPFTYAYSHPEHIRVNYVVNEERECESGKHLNCVRPDERWGQFRVEGIRFLGSGPEFSETQLSNKGEEKNETA